MSAYDPIGNRTSATDYDEQGSALLSTYSVNALNQYTQRTVPGYVSVRGEAATNATVTVNERPVWRIGQERLLANMAAGQPGATSVSAAGASPQGGSYFYGGDSADNTASNLWKELEVYAAINPSGTNTPDTVYAETNRVFIAKTPEQFTYDLDGNMTSDGRFHYFVNNPVTDKKCTTDIIEAFPGAIGLRFKVFSILFDSCCKKHDSCYATCNSNKGSCDDAFGSCMESMCRKNLHNILLPYCLVAAEEYKLGVILFGNTYLAGSQSFNNLQNASCEGCCCE